MNLLAIDQESFLKICEDHTLSKELLVKHARKRKEVFRLYKTKVLIGIMKTIYNKPHIITTKLLKGISIFNKNYKVMKNKAESRIKLMGILILQYLIKKLMKSLEAATNSNSDGDRESSIDVDIRAEY